MLSFIAKYTSEHHLVTGFWQRPQNYLFRFSVNNQDAVFIAKPIGCVEQCSRVFSPVPAVYDERILIASRRQMQGYTPGISGPAQTVGVFGPAVEITCDADTGSRGGDVAEVDNGVIRGYRIYSSVAGAANEKAACGCQ
jgi:hypothetical protein